MGVDTRMLEIVAPGGAWLFSASTFIQVESVAHEGFNWKQQSLLACILFSSRVQRTPIISFLLYCLFSYPRLLPSPESPATIRHHPLFLLVSLPSLVPARSTFFLLSFERFVSRTFHERPRFLSLNRLPRYIPTIASPDLRVFYRCAMHSIALEVMKFLGSPPDTIWKTQVSCVCDKHAG